MWKFLFRLSVVRIHGTMIKNCFSRSKERTSLSGTAPDASGRREGGMNIFNTFIPTHLIVTISAWLGRLVMVVTGIIMVRMLTTALGVEQYGAFAVLAGLQGWFLLLDFGIGSSLQNHISERRSRGESVDAFLMVTLVSGGFISVLFSVGLLVSSPYIAPLLLKSFSSLEAAEKVRCFTTNGILFVIVTVGSISSRIWYAEQRGYLSSIVPAVASVCSLGLVYLVMSLQPADRLFWCVLASGVPSAALLLISFVVQTVSGNTVSAAELRGVLQPLFFRAFKFWGFALLSAFVLQIDYIIMSQFLAAKEIVAYNITGKVFFIAFFLYSAFLSALWPLCTEAAARMEWGLLMKNLRNILISGFTIMTIASVVFYWSMPSIVKILAPSETLIIPPLFILLMGAYFLVRVWADAYSMVLQSMSYLRPFWLLTPFQAIISCALQLFLVPRIGLSGIVIGLLGSFLLTVCWGLPFALRRRMNSQHVAESH